MRKSALVLITFGVAAATALSACSSSGNKATNTSGASGSTTGSSTGSSSSGTAKPAAIVAACKLTNPPTSAAKLPAAATSGKASGKVGVILPDTTSSARYTLYDKPLLQKALTAAGITADIQNASGSTARYQQIAQSM